MKDIDKEEDHLYVLFPHKNQDVVDIKRFMAMVDKSIRKYNTEVSHSITKYDNTGAN